MSHRFIVLCGSRTLGWKTKIDMKGGLDGVSKAISTLVSNFLARSSMTQPRK